jgi:hypothetical protein
MLFHNVSEISQTKARINFISILAHVKGLGTFISLNDGLHRGAHSLFRSFSKSRYSIVVVYAVFYSMFCPSENLHNFIYRVIYPLNAAICFNYNVLGLDEAAGFSTKVQSKNCT